MTVKELFEKFRSALETGDTETIVSFNDAFNEYKTITPGDETSLTWLVMKTMATNSSCFPVKGWQELAVICASHIKLYIEATYADDKEFDIGEFQDNWPSIEDTIKVMAFDNHAILEAYMEWSRAKQDPNAEGSLQIDAPIETGEEQEGGYWAPRDVDKVGSLDTSKIGEFKEGTPTEDEIAIALAFLREVNGQDAYSVASVTVGSLNRNEYLRLPIGEAIPKIEAKDVGNKEVQERFSEGFLAQVYALNARRAPAGQDAQAYGMVRMEAVKMGWYADQKEVIFETPIDPVTAMNELTRAIHAKHEELLRYRRMAFVIPMIAETVFRTMGHHYISGESGAYNTKYRNLLKACLVPSIDSGFSPEVAYHHLFHWISPKRIYEVVTAQKETDAVPDAVKLRLTASPAGCAIICTTAAILKTWESPGIMKIAKNGGRYDIDAILAVDAKIRADPAAYHRSYYAYGKPALSAALLKDFNEAKDEAIALAPIAQGYINALFTDAKMINAKALKKHAEADPLKSRHAERIFMEEARKDVTTLAELFEKPGASSSLTSP